MSLVIFKNAPTKSRVHFKNAAARAKFESGMLTPAEARQSINHVEVRQGIDKKTLNQYLNDMRYAAKINSPEWKAEAERRNAEKLNAHDIEGVV